MKNELFEVYDAKVGDVLVLDEPEEVIYADLLGNMKLGLVHPSPAGQNILTIVDTISASGFARLLVGANFCDQDQMVIAIPKNINESTLKTVIYKLMREKATFYKITIDMGYVIAKKKQPKASNNRKIAVGMLNRLKSEKSKVETRDVDDFMNLGSFAQAVRREASKMMLRVSIQITGNSVEVSLAEKEYVKKVTVFSKEFNSWLDSVRFNRWEPIPEVLMEEGKVPYIKVLLSKSKYDVSYRKGTIFKKLATLVKLPDRLVLRVKGEPVREFIGVTELTDEQKKLVDVLLMPYGMNHAAL
jgi:hypothetical protein